MTRRRKCAHCAKLSIPGLVNPLCQYHYNVAQFGKAWADKCRAENAPRTVDTLKQL